MFFFFQAEDGIRDLVRSRGLGDVYKRQIKARLTNSDQASNIDLVRRRVVVLDHYRALETLLELHDCLLYTSDAADERSSVDLGGRRIIKKKKSGK